MKIVFDNNIPAGLARALPGHEVLTCPKLGWTTLRNGTLLSTAEADGFDLMITADQNLKHQQNLTKRRIALVILGSNRWTIVRHYIVLIASSVEAATPNSYVFIKMPEARRPRS